MGTGAVAAGAGVLAVSEWVVVWLCLGLFAGALTVGLPRAVEIAVGEPERPTDVVD